MLLLTCHQNQPAVKNFACLQVGPRSGALRRAQHLRRLLRRGGYPTLVDAPAAPGTHSPLDLMAWGFDWCEDETPETWLVDTSLARSRKPSTPPPAPQAATLNKWGLEQGFTPENWLVGARDPLPALAIPATLPSLWPSPVTSSRDGSAVPDGCTPWDWLVPELSSAA